MSDRSSISDYLNFTRRLWGSVANASVLFPFSGLLAKELEVDPVTAVLSSVACTAVILLAWVGRRESWLFEVRRLKWFNLTIIGELAIALGLLLAVVYVFFSPELSVHAWEPHFIYLGAFTSLTAGFAAFGLKEYLTTADVLPFNMIDSSDELIRIHVARIAKHYLRIDPDDLRVVSHSFADGEIHLTVADAENRRYEAVINNRGSMVAFSEYGHAG